MALTGGGVFIPIKPLLNKSDWSPLKKSLAVTAGVTAGLGVAAFKVGKSFNDMRNTIIVGTGASGKALAGLEKSAKSVGKTTPSSFEDIGTAIADVNTRLGLTGKPLEDMTSRFLNLSRITGTDLKKNIADSSRVFGDWGIVAKDQPKALDAIFEATKRTGIGLDKLTNNVVQFGAPLRQFGFDFEESLALFGKWEKEGVNTQVVLSGMKQALGRFSKAGKDPKKALDEVSEAIKNAGSAGEANRIAIEAFGQRAGPDMAAAVREGRFEIADMAKALKGSKGAISDADKRTRTFSESWQIFKNRAMIKVAPMATEVFDALTKLGNWMNNTGVPVLGKMAGFVKDNSTAFKILTGVIAALTVVTIAHGAVLAVTAAGGMMAYLKATKLIATGIKVWTAVQWVLNAALTANPIGLVVVGIVALIAVVVLIATKTTWFQKLWGKAWGGIQKAFSAVLGFIKKNWPTILAILTGPIGLAVLAIAKNWGKIKSGAAAVKDFVGRKFSEIGSAIGALPGKITALGGKMLTAGTTIMGRLFAGIKAGASAVGGFVSDFASSIAQAIKNAANSALGLPKRITLGGKMGIPEVGFTIPAFARGGLMKRSGMALVGEEGAELVRLPQGARVFSAQQTRSMARDLIGANAVPGFRPRVGSPSFDGAGALRGPTVAAGAVQVNMSATATPETAGAAAGGRVLAALSAWGV